MIKTSDYCFYIVNLYFPCTFPMPSGLPPVLLNCILLIYIYILFGFIISLTIASLICDTFGPVFFSNVVIIILFQLFLLHLSNFFKISNGCLRMQIVITSSEIKTKFWFVVTKSIIKYENSISSDLDRDLIANILKTETHKGLYKNCLVCYIHREKCNMRKTCVFKRMVNANIE